MNVDCDKIKKHNYKEFNIEYLPQRGYEQKYIEYGYCFLDKSYDHLKDLENTSANCIYKVFTHQPTGEQLFIKVQISKDADSLQDESKILEILNLNHNICAILKSKFVVYLEFNQNKINITYTGTPRLSRPCIVTTAYTNFKSFESVYLKLMKNKIQIHGEIFFNKLFDLFIKLINLSKKNNFIHNDLHMNNIIYDCDANSLAMLDFGRSYINIPSYQLSVNQYRCVPNIADKIPVMIDIMGLCKSIVDDMYMRYFRSNKDLENILKPISCIYNVEYNNNELRVKFVNIDKTYFNTYVNRVMSTPLTPIARELIPGIIYLVIYLNTCKTYISLNNIDIGQKDKYFYLPYKSLLNRRDIYDTYAPFLFGNRIMQTIYEDNFKNFNVYEIFTTKIDDYINLLRPPMPGGLIIKGKTMKTEVEPSLPSTRALFNDWIKQLPEITHEQAYDVLIKARFVTQPVVDEDFGEEDIILEFQQNIETMYAPKQGGRRVLHLNNNG